MHRYLNVHTFIAFRTVLAEQTKLIKEILSLRCVDDKKSGFVRLSLCSNIIIL